MLLRLGRKGDKEIKVKIKIKAATVPGSILASISAFALKWVSYNKAMLISRECLNSALLRYIVCAAQFEILLRNLAKF